MQKNDGQKTHMKKGATLLQPKLLKACIMVEITKEGVIQYQGLVRISKTVS